MKEVNAAEIFTPRMIQDARKCANAIQIADKVIKPNIAWINKVTGQENNELYMAYMLQHVIIELGE